VEPTQVLRDEHRGIGLMLEIVGKVCARLEKGDKVEPDHLQQIVDFFRVFADKCHHGKEEDQLFPALKDAGEGGPVGVMLAEHGTGRQYVRGMGDAVAGVRSGDRAAVSRFVENARNYSALLSNHINKENSVLFPLAERLLPPEKRNEMFEAFERIEEERIGAGTQRSCTSCCASSRSSTSRRRQSQALGKTGFSLEGRRTHLPFRVGRRGQPRPAGCPKSFGVCGRSIPDPGE